MSDGRPQRLRRAEDTLQFAVCKDLSGKSSERRLVGRRPGWVSSSEEAMAVVLARGDGADREEVWGGLSSCEQLESK